jgi:hypothetical protein
MVNQFTFFLYFFFWTVLTIGTLYA